MHKERHYSCVSERESVCAYGGEAKIGRSRLTAFEKPRNFPFSFIHYCTCTLSSDLCPNSYIKTQIKNFVFRGADAPTDSMVVSVMLFFTTV